MVGNKKPKHGLAGLYFSIEWDTEFLNFLPEWFPKSFQSKLAKERNLVGLRCSSSVEMMARNQIAPFHFSRSGVFYVLALRYGRLDDYLAQINQLRRAATLPPVEQNAMIATICYSIQSRLAFDSCWLESVKETILLKVGRTDA